MLRTFDILKLTRVIIAAVLTGLAVSACDDDPSFRISGTVDGLGTRHISMVYPAEGALHTVTVTAIDGKFSLEGSSREYTLVELLNPQGSVFARMLVKNGQNIKCDLDIVDPYKLRIKGNKPSEQWADFLTKNREVLTEGTSEMINNLIAEYVKTHPDNILSSMLLLTLYDSADNESQGGSLFASLAPEARPDKLVADYRLLLSQNNNAAINTKVRPMTLYTSKDSLERFVPMRSSYSLLYFVPSKQQADTAIRAIEPAYERYSRRRLRVLEISFAPDSAQWKKSVEGDTLKWKRTWAPGGIAAPNFYELSIPRLPYYIVADSAGSQVYRGASIDAAIDSIDSRLSSKTK